MLNSNALIQWKPIKGYEDLYEVSSLGIVRRASSKKEIKPWERGGYFCVALCKKGNVQKTNVHRLVAEAFVPNPLNKPLVNHLNGNKLTNTACNLEWCTHSENHKHAYALGLKDPKTARPPIGNNKGSSSKYRYVTYFKNTKEEKFVASIKAGNFFKSRSFSVKKYGGLSELLAAKAVNDLIDQYPEFADRPKNVF